MKNMNICKNCNTEFSGGDFCPQCGTKIEEIQAVEAALEPTEEAVTEQIEEVTQAVETQEAAEENTQEVFTLPPQPVPVVTPVQPIAQPSKFNATINQAVSVIKNFFSKNAVDAVSAQYGEKLNIWVILLALPAIFSAISGLIHYESPAVDLLNFFSAKYNIVFGRFGYMISGFFFALALELSFVFVFYFYSKISKKDMSLTGCANLVSAAYLPMTVISAAYVLCGSGVDIVFAVAFVMFVFLLHKGIEKAFNDEKPVFWSFFLAVVVALAVFTVAAAVISVPAWIIDKINEVSQPAQDIMNNYDYFSEFPFYY